MLSLSLLFVFALPLNEGCTFRFGLYFFLCTHPLHLLLRRGRWHRHYLTGDAIGFLFIFVIRLTDRQFGLNRQRAIVVQPNFVEINAEGMTGQPLGVRTLSKFGLQLGQQMLDKRGGRVSGWRCFLGGDEGRSQRQTPLAERQGGVGENRWGKREVSLPAQSLMLIAHIANSIKLRIYIDNSSATALLTFSSKWNLIASDIPFS
jgi:hypothetical protein